MSIAPERWLANLIDAARSIADKERQERRWLASDVYAWERPEEDISVLMDDSVLDGFIEEYAATFSPIQSGAIMAFRDAIDEYCDAMPGFLDPADVLADLRWHHIRQDAGAFIAAFEGKWNPGESRS